MKKFALAAFASIFIFSSPVTMASGNLESGLTPIRADDVMNYIQCRDKKPTDTVKSRTKVKNGKIVVVKCADANKIVSDARAQNK